VVNGCDPATTTVSTGDVTVTFPGSGATFLYTPSCIKVHAGATVTWNGDLASHPLEPDGSGNPIVSTSSGTSVTFTFPTDGSFGFHCAFHSTMLGAVFVVP
jgi:plastocyanin